jgi:hypothetical protein
VLAALRSRSVLSMLMAAAVMGVGMFGAPAPAQAGGGTKIVVATPGVFVAIGDRDHKRYYRDYDRKDYRDYRYRDHKYRDYDRGYRHRDYDRHRYKDRGYHRGHYKRFDCDRRGRRYRY